MAITVTWSTKVINVPRADMSLIQSMPTEIRELNINSLRLTLKELEAEVTDAGAGGMAFIDTHSHNAPVTVGGVTLARVVEIINGYTITFEDGQYAVNLVGANSNVSDVTNVNQVSIRASNSAGLISSSALEFSNYAGSVTIDVTSTNTGTVYPVGIASTPVNNLVDAIAIARNLGIRSLFVVGDLTIDENVSALQIYGDYEDTTNIIIDPSANVTGSEFVNCTLSGEANGSVQIRRCTLVNLTNLEGSIESSRLTGTISALASSTAELVIRNCVSFTTGASAQPSVNMGGDGPTCVITDYSGNLEITNLTTATNPLFIDMNSGNVTLDATITAGAITVRGIGDLTDNSTGTTIFSEIMNRENAAYSVWEEPSSSHTTNGSIGSYISKIVSRIVNFLS